MRHHLLSYFSLLILFLFNNGRNLSAQDFRQLMQNTEESMGQKLVTGASRRLEKISSSLSVSTVFTQNQIKELRVSSLYELLSYVPGFELTESFFGYTTVNVRGILQANYNNKILLLINGHPFLESVNGNAHLEIIPIQAISKVEVIRGPGSVLYGTNAYAGVISVETLDGGSYENSSFSLETGSHHTSRMGMNMVLNNGTKGGLFLSSNIVSRNSWTYRPETAAQAAPFDYSSDLQNLYLNWKNQNVTLQIGHFAHDKMRFGFTMNPGMATGMNQFDGTFLDLSWLYKTADGSQFKIRYGYTEQERIYNFPPPMAPTRNPSEIHRFEISYDQKISPRLRNITGLVHEQFITTREPIDSATSLGQAYQGLRKHETIIEALFTQFDYELHEKMAVLLACRATLTAG
jgi:outer membrane cobalamin receptor